MPNHFAPTSEDHSMQQLLQKSQVTCKHKSMTMLNLFCQGCQVVSTHKPSILGLFCQLSSICFPWHHCQSKVEDSPLHYHMIFVILLRDFLHNSKCRSCCIWKMTFQLTSFVDLGSFVLFCIVDLCLLHSDFVYPIDYHCLIVNWNISIGLTHHSIQILPGCHILITRCSCTIFLEVRSMPPPLLYLSFYI